MSNDKQKPAEPKPPLPKGKPAPVPLPVAKAKAVAPPALPPPPPPLFRKVDWFTFGITTLLVFIGYYLTLTPDLTLEDAGELATGSFYAGVPHPPGYPVWTLYSWLFTLIPISNIAWRVALSSAVAGALSCGLIGLLVSRGSSMILEGIAEFKSLDRKWENALCVASGYVAGMLLGFNGFMWSQAVIVEVYPLSVLSLMGVLCCLLRWMYAPTQLRYLYWAAFIFGICFTNHQTLIVAAVGIEVAVLAAQPRLGRDLFLANSLIFILGLVLKANKTLTMFDNNAALYNIYLLIGIGSIITCGWLAVQTTQLFSEWKKVVIIGTCWVLGAAFYFYMPLASMTNPPLNWGYARTVEGFAHALSRGQYEKANPTNVFNDPGRFIHQLWRYAEAAKEEFNLVYLLIGLVPFLFFFRMASRERAWIAGLSAIFVCLGILLLILLNPPPDRQGQQLNRVFFTASFVIVSMLVGYGLTLIGALLATQYERWRTWAMWGCVAAAGLAFYTWKNLENMSDVSSASVLSGLVLAIVAAVVLGVLRERAPMSCVIAMMAIMPVYSILAHWAANEQRGHLFGYWFGHDMFTPPFKGKDGKPLYPEMARDAVLFGGTDPGRFNPTYMIFCESFIPARCKPNDPQFDRRDVYLITQNALADGTYLNYIRAHYNRSEQKDPLFFSELLRSGKERERNISTNLLARMAKPLDIFFTSLGQRIEDRRRAKGVYPLKEILTPTVADSQQAFNEYMNDAGTRLQHDTQFPNEPKQIKPGEDIRQVDNRITVSGQVAVMAINGLLTKVIFDKNPTHEFYVEESFPLDWMFPHLSPFRIIMKINRQPVPEFTQELVDRDHEFWTQFSERLTGNWINYDTSVSNICAFAEKAYYLHNDTVLSADPKFLRDDSAQKAFSKLRSAIGGLYAWRINHCAAQLDQCNKQLGQARTPAQQQPLVAEQQRLVTEQKRMIKEADFALRQSFAFCPYSPEATYRYVNLLISLNRAEDAKRVAKTCLLLDPANENIKNLADQLENIVNQMKKPAGAALPASTQVPSPAPQTMDLGPYEALYNANPSDLTNAINLFSVYLQVQQTQKALVIVDRLVANPQADVQTLLSAQRCYEMAGQPAKRQNALARAAQVVEQHLANPQADAGTLMNAAQVYAIKQDGAKLELVLARLVKVTPDVPEAWYDLSTVQATMRKDAPAMVSLSRALALSAQRLKQDPKARDLYALVAQDAHFVFLRPTPEFQKLIQPK